MNHKYEIDIFWSEEDQVFLAEAPDLPGCMAHGSTHADALAELQQAIAGWIEVLRQNGDPVPEPRPRGPTLT